MNDETIEFLWLAQRDSRVSLMTVGSDKHVFHLQMLIHEAGKNGVFRDTDARDLVLWMVSTFENAAFCCSSRCLIAQRTRTHGPALYFCWAHSERGKAFRFCDRAETCYCDVGGLYETAH
jgi:hypothetical protein